MKHIDLPHEEELLPIFDPNTYHITGIENRKEAHRSWLHHAHVNVWIPGTKGGIIYKQLKTRSHWKADATIGGHISCTADEIEEILWKHIEILWPWAAVREWHEETGLVFTESELVPLGQISETWKEPHPTSKTWNNGIALAYMLNRRVKPKDIIENPHREDGLDFEEVDIETLLGLTEKDYDKYLHKLIGESYKEIFHTLREQLKQI